MRLSPPKQITWLIALILAILALLGKINVVDVLSVDTSFWLAFASALLLILATWLKNL